MNLRNYKSQAPNSKYKVLALWNLEFKALEVINSDLSQLDFLGFRQIPSHSNHLSQILNHP